MRFIAPPATQSIRRVRAAAAVAVARIRRAAAFRALARRWRRSECALQQGGKCRTGDAAVFVAQTPALLADGLHYEQRIAERGEIATREGNWHDLLNALIWLRFPRTEKRAESAPGRRDRHRRAEAAHARAMRVDPFRRRPACRVAARSGAARAVGCARLAWPVLARAHGVAATAASMCWCSVMHCSNMR